MKGFDSCFSWLLSHFVRARRMGERGHEYVEQTFESEKLIRQMVEQWQRLVQMDAELADHGE